jgi:hypothetical protein
MPAAFRTPTPGFDAITDPLCSPPVPCGLARRWLKILNEVYSPAEGRWELFEKKAAIGRECTILEQPQPFLRSSEDNDGNSGMSGAYSI